MSMLFGNTANIRFDFKGRQVEIGRPGILMMCGEPFLIAVVTVEPEDVSHADAVNAAAFVEVIENGVLGKRLHGISDSSKLLLDMLKIQGLDGDDFFMEASKHVNEWLAGIEGNIVKSLSAVT
jgi:hypothetical protein